MPLETISLPTKATIGCRGPPPRRGRNSSVSTPGGPSLVFSRRPGTIGSASQSDSAVWWEPVRTQEAASIPSSA